MKTDLRTYGQGSKRTRLGFALLFCFSVFCGGSLFAQQDPMYSQYMFNGLVVNPAYAGSRDALSTMLLGRWQWVGIDGAPMTQNLSIHTPTRNRRNGFGLMVVNDRVSYIGQTWLNFSYAYRIPLGKKARLALGLQGSMYNYRINWDKAMTINPGDPVTSTYSRNMWLPNVGYGMYFSSERAYLGISAPRLLVNRLSGNSLDIKIFEKDTTAALRRHFFLTGGYVFKLSPDFKLKPSFLVKYLEGSVLQVDANLNVYFMNRFGIGASYRMGDGIACMADFLITKQLRIGYAYDYPLTHLKYYTSGSHELMLGFDFYFENDEVVSPRFF